MGKKGRYNPHFENSKSVENFIHPTPLEAQSNKDVEYKPPFYPKIIVCVPFLTLN